MPKVSEISSTNPILESFELIGVNGFKNLKLETSKCVRIIVAENGTGKTTLLNALYAVLSKRLLKLNAIDFKSLKIKFFGQPELAIKKDELLSTNLKPSSESAFSEILSYGFNEAELFDFFSTTEGTITFQECIRHTLFSQVYQEGPYDPEETVSLFRRAMPAMEKNTHYSKLIDYISAALGDLKVLYLPTFRRIEVELSEFDKRSRRAPFPRWTEQSSAENSEDRLIWFGMKDVEEQLDSIRERINSKTFDAYSRLSVRSLEDLLSPNSKEPEKIPSEDETLRSRLKLVLARLGQADGESDNKISALIESGEINNESYDSLRSYLFQMLEIYTSTENDEKSIEGFISVINNYWATSAFESSSTIEKKFNFDKMSLSIDIRTPYSPDPLGLGHLSSGEKQIVSIFARLHLQRKNKFIVLIDEPELSLSMAWQKLFLPDILESPSCAQLIAITHSPFIFDNALDPFANSLLISYGEK